MPTYSAVCPACNHHQDYFSKIDNRHITPACEACGTTTARGLDTPMIPCMAIADSMHVVSPIDGSVLRNSADYKAHCKKHNVLPTSEFEGVKKVEQKPVTQESIRAAASQAYDKLVAGR